MASQVSIEIEIQRSLCKTCGICVAFCPRSVLEKDASGIPAAMRAGDCVGCGMCEYRCPDFAIRVRRKYV